MYGLRWFIKKHIQCLPQDGCLGLKVGGSPTVEMASYARQQPRSVDLICIGRWSISSCSSPNPSTPQLLSLPQNVVNSLVWTPIFCCLVVFRPMPSEPEISMAAVRVKMMLPSLPSEFGQDCQLLFLFCNMFDLNLIAFFFRRPTIVLLNSLKWFCSAWESASLILQEMLSSDSRDHACLSVTVT